MNTMDVCIEIYDFLHVPIVSIIREWLVKRDDSHYVRGDQNIIISKDTIGMLCQECMVPIEEIINPKIASDVVSASALFSYKITFEGGSFWDKDAISIFGKDEIKTSYTEIMYLVCKQCFFQKGILRADGEINVFFIDTRPEDEDGLGPGICCVFVRMVENKKKWFISPLFWGQQFESPCYIITHRRGIANKGEKVYFPIKAVPSSQKTY